jgi:hypothetical protein
MKNLGGLKFNKLNWIFLFFCLFLPLFQPISAPASYDTSPIINENFKARSYVVLSGSIIKKQEIRISNSSPLSGRQDILKSIILTVKIDTFFKRKAPVLPGTVAVSVSGKELLNKYKSLSEGSNGIFYLAGVRLPYVLIAFDPLTTK